MRVWLSIALFLFSAAFSQTVNISGTVSDASAQPIEGAVIQLSGAGLSAVSGADGTYLLSGIVMETVHPGTAGQVAYKLSYSNGIFHLCAPVRSRVRLSLHGLTGRLTAEIFSGVMASENVVVPFSINEPAGSLQILRLEMGGTLVKSILLTRASGSFSAYGLSPAAKPLAKASAVDWIQASKAGYASYSQPIDAYTGTINITLGSLSAPDFGPNVHIFDDGMNMATIQSTLNGHKNSTSHFSSQRTAWFFKPGSYNLDITIDYFIQAYGLGLSPEDVQVTGAVQNLDGGTGAFWRGVEGFSVTPSSGTVVWAVSQAAPFRRMHAKGDVLLCNGSASGGFISDAVIDGLITTACGQQFYIRNTNLNGVNSGGVGGMWNLLLHGTGNPPAETFPDAGGITVLENVPLVREKPYIVFNEATDSWSVFRPALRAEAQGPTWSNGDPAGELMPLDQFYIARSGTDNAASINAALASGKNLLLTPGIYDIVEPIVVERPGTVVLGLAMATLYSANGSLLMKTANAPGINIANVYFDAGPVNSPVLFQVGEKGHTGDFSANPVFLHDIFIRVGGAGAARADTCMIINTNNTILDHCWIWRADHGTGAGWASNPSEIGLVVNGDYARTYAQMVEHFQSHQTVWNGNFGETYFYQCEFPYDVPSQDVFMWNGQPGIPAYYVTDGVTNFIGWAIGIYSYFRNAPITVTNAIVVPDVAGVELHHLVTFSLGRDQGTILHAVNDTGPAVKWDSDQIMYRFGDYVGGQ